MLSHGWNNPVGNCCVNETWISPSPPCQIQSGAFQFSDASNTSLPKLGRGKVFHGETNDKN